MQADTLSLVMNAVHTTIELDEQLSKEHIRILIEFYNKLLSHLSNRILTTQPERLQYVNLLLIKNLSSYKVKITQKYQLEKLSPDCVNRIQEAIEISAKSSKFFYIVDCMYGLKRLGYNFNKTLIEILNNYLNNHKDLSDELSRTNPI